MTNTSATRRDLQDWSLAAVKLLQGVVEYDDEQTWDLILRNRSTVESYFSRIGLVLVVHEADGYAYLRQGREGEFGEGSPELPKLIRRRSLSYGATVLAVLLREELRRSDEQVDRPRCAVELAQLFETWRNYFPAGADGRAVRSEFESALAAVTQLGFLRKLGNSDETAEIRRVIKARLPIEELERLRDELQREAASRRREQDG